MADSRELQLIVNLKDNVSTELQKVGGRLGDFNKHAERIGANLKNIGVGMTAIGTAGVLAFGKTVKDAAEFEKAMSNVSTLISGDSSDAINKLSSGIQEMLAHVPKNANELGASAYAIVSAGISDTSQVLGVLEQSARLATAGLGTTEEATDLMTSAINAFGLDANEASVVADTLFKTVKAGKTDVSQLAQAFGATAPVIAAAGIQLEDFQAATAALTTTGLPAAQAQNGLRAAIVALQKPTKEMKELFDKVGVDSMESLIRSSENMGEAFGKLRNATDGNNEMWAKALGSVEALNAATGILTTSSNAYQSTLYDMMEASNAIDSAFEKQTKTFDAQMQILKNNVMQVSISIGNVLLPILSDVVEMIKPVVQRVTEWIEKNPELTKKIVLVAAALFGLLAVLGPIVIGLGTLIGSVALFGSAIGTAIIVITTIVAALGQIVFFVIKTKQVWEDLKEHSIETWNAIKNTVIPVIDSIKNFIVGTWNSIKEFFSGVWDAIVQIFKFQVALAIGIVIAAFDAMGIDIVAVLKFLFDTFVAWWQNVQSGFQVFTQFVQTAWSAFWQLMTEIFLPKIQQIQEIVSVALTFIRDLFQKVADPIKQAWQSMWDGIKNIVVSGVELAKSVVKNMVNFVIDKINYFIRKANEIAKKASVIPGISASSIPQLPEIPRLAKGGIVTRPTLAEIGEAGPEAVIPLRKMNSFGGGVTINIYGDVTGQELVEKVEQAIMGKLKMNQRLAT